MLEYFKTRLLQPTTWLGLASIAATLFATGGVITPSMIGEICIAFGLVHVNERT